MRHAKPLRCLVFQQAQSAGKLKKSIKQRKAVNYIFQKKLFTGAIPPRVYRFPYTSEAAAFHSAGASDASANTVYPNYRLLKRKEEQCLKITIRIRRNRSLRRK